MAGSTMIDLTGRRFGRLVVLSRDGTIKTNVAWLCQCDCGQGSRVAGNRLREGKTQSCGCLQDESRMLATRTHGDSRTRLFRIWTGMRTRCTNPNAIGWKDYGGRGISLCPEWIDDFAAFRCWALQNGYAANLTIERNECDGGYTPGNCCWIPKSMQSANRRVVRRLPDGRRIIDVARSNGLKESTAQARIRNGWDPYIACAAPAGALPPR